MSKKNSIPVYLQIAVDVAGRIVRNELSVGQKISGRTTLASEYNVSPETIRKAMTLLRDVSIVEVKHGNGIHVASVENAERFIENNRVKVTVNDLKDEMMSLIGERDAIEAKMTENIHAIIDYTSRFKSSDHITVHEYSLDYEVFEITLTVRDLNLKAHTGATLVGIKRNGVIMLSPDDEEIICVGDRLLYVGVPSSSVRLGEYLREIYGECKK